MVSRLHVRATSALLRAMSQNPATNSRSAPPGFRAVAWQPSTDSALAVAVGATVAILLGVGLLVFARRLAGALSEDMPRDVMLLTAVTTTATLTCARLAWRRRFPLSTEHGLGRWDQLIGWGSSLALFLLAVGSCYPANHTSDLLIWLPLLVADQLWRQTFFDADSPGDDVVSDQDCGTQLPPPATESEEPSAGDRPSGHLVQQLFRLRDRSGSDVIYGTVRADFQMGQRTAVVYVGFCPPLNYLPEIEAEAWHDTPARIKVVQALAHGARLDVRLASPAAEADSVWIDMAATPVDRLASEISA